MKALLLIPFLALVAQLSSAQEIKPGTNLMFTPGKYLAMKSNNWMELTKSIARERQIVRRILGDGNTESFFADKNNEINTDLAKMIKDGDSLILDWKKLEGHDPLAKQYLPLLEQCQNILKGAIYKPAPLENSIKGREILELQALEKNGVEGVPPDVMKEIIEKVKSDPSTFSATYSIQDEAKYYLAIKKFEKDTIFPDEIRKFILDKAKREDGKSWRGMFSVVDRQSSGWKKIREWEESGTIPGASKEETIRIIAEAKKRHPNDWGMIEFDAAHAVGKPQSN